MKAGGCPWPGWAIALLLPAAVAPAQASPAAGNYAATLCVTQAEQPATCGPVQARLARNGLRLRLSDIVYRLELRGNQLDVTLMHGAMQIDEFSAAFDWSGDTLRFGDAQKRTLYEVQLGERQTKVK
jgi:hypothetical protein